jgi:tetratricopeptide (TPR) repeat protein
MIGKLLDRRYRIIKVLGTGEFGQTYLAADTHRPGYPQCVVKQLRPPSNNPRTLQIIELIFKKKAESLEKLGKHDQIPQLLAFFEEDKEFFLVEEFIAGRPLSADIGQGNPLEEAVVVSLLQEILEILVFVHGHGIVHRDINPDNLIRRQLDNQLVLINFGPIKEISYQLMKTQGQSSLNGSGEVNTYVPLESAQLHAPYGDDLYAVGAIAIQAVSGLSARELPPLSASNGTKGEVAPWRQNLKVSGEFARILEKMVHANPGDRYLSATEVLADLRKLNPRSEGVFAAIAPPPPPVTSPPAQTPEERPRPALKRSSSRWRSPVSSVSLLWSAIGILGAVGVVVVLWLFLAQSARHRVDQLKTTGLELVKRGDPQAALEEFNQAVELEPDNPEAHYNRGNVHYDLGNYQAALEDYDRTLELSPNKINAFYNRGLTHYELENYPEAIADFTRAIDANPNDADAYYKRGLVYYELLDYEKAIADYTEAIRLDPQQANLALLNRGLSRSASGDKQGAIADFTEVLRSDRNNPDAFYSRGRDRFFLADYQGAMEDYSEAIRLNPGNPAYYTNRCATYLNLSQYDKAIADCTKAIELDPKDGTAYGNRCIAHVNLGNAAQAVVDCTEAIQIHPDYAKFYSNRGLARSVSGDKAGAIADYTKAIQLVPSDAVAYSNRAAAYGDTGNTSAAIADYSQAIRLKPDFDRAYYDRALLRAQLGDKPGAIEDLQKAATLCLDRGQASCYNDAQAQIRQLR